MLFEIFLYWVIFMGVSFPKNMNVPKKVGCRRTVKSALTFSFKSYSGVLKKAYIKKGH